jgi:hypothetical protein
MRDVVSVHREIGKRAVNPRGFSKQSGDKTSRKRNGGITRMGVRLIFLQEKLDFA